MGPGTSSCERGGVGFEPCEVVLLKGGTWNMLTPGLGGTLVDGLGASTIHMRCDRVAHSLATVCASVLNGVT